MWVDESFDEYYHSCPSKFVTAAILSFVESLTFAERFGMPHDYWSLPRRYIEAWQTYDTAKMQFESARHKRKQTSGMPLDALERLA